MVGELLVGSSGSTFRFLCHDWWTFSGVRVVQSLDFCVMLSRLCVVYRWFDSVVCVASLGNFVFEVRVAQSLVFCVVLCVVYRWFLVWFVLPNL